MKYLVITLGIFLVLSGVVYSHECEEVGSRELPPRWFVILAIIVVPICLFGFWYIDRKGVWYWDCF